MDIPSPQPLSWIIGGSQVKYFANKLLSQFCRSFDLFTGTCWVPLKQVQGHTAHLPKSAVLDLLQARKVSQLNLIGSSLLNCLS